MGISKNGNVLFLLAEDDDDDYLITLDALSELGLEKNVKRVKDGDELMKYLLHQPPFEQEDDSPTPDMIFLDLNMPRKDGREALKEIKSNSELKKIPIIILTTSNSPDDIASTYEYGANSYIQKPDSYDRFIEIFRIINDYWLDIVKLPSPAV